MTARLDVAMLHERGLVPAPLPVAPLLTAAEEARERSVDDALEVLRSLACTEIHSDGCARCERARDAADVIRVTFDFAGGWIGRAQRNLDEERRRVAAAAAAVHAFLARPESLGSATHGEALALLAQIAGQP